MQMNSLLENITLTEQNQIFLQQTLQLPNCQAIWFVTSIPLNLPAK